MSKLYIVSTPIGNLEDITLRALRILEEVDLVLAEDTRITRRLLDKYNIKTAVERFDAKIEAKNPKRALSLLKNNKDLALVSDAGTPGISDPGNKLISYLVKKLKSNKEETKLINLSTNQLFNLVPIPGASSLSATLSVAGLEKTDFTFLGFLPHKKGRETLFKEIAESKRNFVFFESPHRIMKTLKSLEENIPIYRHITIARELTKIHEEVISGSTKELLDYFESQPEKVKGEFVIIVHK